MSKATVDKWETKKFIEIHAPAFFNDAFIGETFSANPTAVVGRVIEANLTDVIGGDPRNQKFKLAFKIIDVKGDKAYTEFLGHRISQDYEHSLVRRRMSKLYTNQQVTTKDSKKLSVKSIIITQAQINKSRLSSIGKVYKEFVTSEAKEEHLMEFINSILSGKLVSKAKKAIHSVYPVRQVVIQKTEIL